MCCFIGGEEQGETYQRLEVLEGLPNESYSMATRPYHEKY